ncbi:MAG: hypothetical protein KC587_13550 [Nitrospira sp.]|nr:hypothetical protein [Nitrospira sp.]MCA9457685.1 hypothetical protein [Nitrospira sp.]MCW5783295.1 hypothetical protein [Nitrospirales bacterium]
MQHLLKRMNFFQGFFTQAEDWQANQSYFVQKTRLHNAYLHTKGIVPNCLGGFGVEASRDGTALLIRSGYAIDQEGRELFMPNAQEIMLDPQDYQPPSILYVRLRYREIEIDPRPNAANPEYTGHAFVQETPTVEVTVAGETEDDSALELARIELSREATRIKDAEDAEKPGPNEIDLRFRPVAGALPGRVTLSHMGEVVRSGELRVASTPETKPDPGDPNILIERVELKQDGDGHRHYQVSAYPIEEGRITWRVESIFNKQHTEYRLFFKNFHDRAARVMYEVVRFHP